MFIINLMPDLQLSSIYCPVVSSMDDACPQKTVTQKTFEQLV